jgi:anti-sigma regulatory factor (Ser/Thr protein kinase)
MTYLNRPTRVADAAFTLVDGADARTVAHFRSELSRWLHSHLALDPARHNDVLLAVNEALTNSADHAYGTGHGPMTMQVRYLAAGDTLLIDVSDHGAWQDTDPATRSNTRGRGIPLMRALADHATISPLPSGTQVRLQFDDCALAAADAYAVSV